MKKSLFFLLSLAILSLSTGITFAESSNPYLKSIGKDIVLDPTDGKETVSDFKGWTLDKDWNLNVASKPTQEMKVQVFEMTRDAKFNQLFRSFGKNLDRLCLTQSQIKKFYKEHAGWLGADGHYGTFFLFKVGKDYFVAVVLQGADHLTVARLSWDYYVWPAENCCKIVVPQS